jgi:hypothetical protein
MFRCLVIFMCFSSTLLAQEKSLDKYEETPEERREGIVFQAIADMIANRDQLLKTFAVVLEGEESDLESDRPHVYPKLVIRCVSKKHQYDYAAQVDFQPQLQFDDQETIAGIRNLESWQECVQCRGEYKAFNGEKRLGDSYRYVGKGKDAMKAMREMGLVVPRFDPFDDFVAYSSMFLSNRSNPGLLENLLLTHSKLVSTEQLVGGEILTNWEQVDEKGQVRRTFNIKLSEANSSMPLEIAYKYPDPRNFSITKIYWRNHKGGELLPWRIECAHAVFNGSGARTNQYAFKLRWLVGDELPDSVFDFKADPRDPLMKLFGIDYEKDGQPAKNPWKVPEDLYQFESSKQK